ncbi:MAG TPA: VTT domain-containing protein, partial [Candidatus Paceibacterota bacterium]
MANFAYNLLAGIPDIIASGGYSILSAVVILEGLPVIGSIFPGHIAIIAAGFLAKLGVFNIFIVIGIGIIMNILGDIVGYLLGRKYGYGLLQKFGKYILMREVHIEKAKNLIDKHTGKAIIFGKFSPITRPLVPFAVGASGVHIKTFWFYNILGGTLWVVSSVLVGYIFGASYGAASVFFGKFILLAIVISILILWGYRFVNVHFHIFKKYELFILIINILSLWVLAKTIQDSFSKSSFLTNFDISLNIFMAEYITPFLAKIALFISTVGNTEIVASIGFIIGIIFLIKRKWRRGAIMLLSVVLTSGLTTIMKDFFMRERPLNSLTTAFDPSFPSGHSSLAAAFFLAAAYIFIPKMKS